MTYTMDLNDWEANALRAMMKSAFIENANFIEKNNNLCKVAPEMKSFTDFAMKEQVLYNKVYMALKQGANNGKT